MAIELRPLQTLEATDGDLDEIVASNASVHLEVLDDNAIMLIVEDEQQQVHLRITHRGKSPMRVWVYEQFGKEKARQCEILTCHNPAERMHQLAPGTNYWLCNDCAGEMEEDKK